MALAGKAVHEPRTRGLYRLLRAAGRSLGSWQSAGNSACRDRITPRLHTAWWGGRSRRLPFPEQRRRQNATVRATKRRWFLALGTLAALVSLQACNRSKAGANAEPAAPATVAVAKVARKALDRELRVSSELVPFQEIDVYAKESGFVKKLLVDYGTRVRQGQLIAVLEIPELEAQLREDEAMAKNAADRISRAEHQVSQAQAQHGAEQLQADRLTAVSKDRPGLVAQQEVDDAQGRNMASESAVDAAKSNLDAVRSDLLAAQAKSEHDRVLLAYSQITAPFAGVVTQRYANLGTLVQAGTSSSTQAMPLVKLSQDDLFRLVIPVPETYVRFIRIGEPVEVSVPSLGRTFPGQVSRFAVDVKEDTRTMHTEVDVPNLNYTLVPGMYAEAVLRLEHKPDATAVPLQAVDRQGDQATVYLVDASGRLEQRTVTLGMQTDTDAEVLSGLAPGDLVVVSDRGGLKAGQQVNPQLVAATGNTAEKER